MKQAFTMAEILLSLTIIGVVAAITLPSLTGNINERTWNTQRKALFARFSQAIALMPSLNGYGLADTAATTENQAAETFITSGLSKVLKINNICDFEHLADCGIPNKITALDGTIAFSSTIPTALSELNNLLYGEINIEDNIFSNPDAKLNTKAAAFETQNGESILTFYNPNCKNSMQEMDWHYTQPYMCANFIYDLNGSKGPNTVGKDIGFMTAIYASDSIVVAPMPLNNDATQSNVSYQEALGYCKTQDSESRIPNRYELASMFYNKRLINNIKEDGSAYWSSSIVSLTNQHSGTKVWHQSFNVGNQSLFTSRGYVRCIKR